MNKTAMPRLTAVQQAQARQHSYHLFGRLFLAPITAELLPYLESIPELAAVLPTTFGVDEMAAAHHQLFAFNLYPYASIFLDPSRLLGGQVTNEMEAVYQQAGYEENSAVDPDHLGQAFGFLAFLSEREATALDSGQAATAVQQAQFHFLDNHLLPWLIPAVIAIQQQEDAFYRELARLALGLAADHFEVLKTAELPQTSIPLPTLTGQTAEQPTLEDGRTGLRDIARYLITPIQSGIYLGRSDINRLARRISLPHGFGSREQMLQTLLEVAGQYDAAPHLFEALQKLVTTWRKAYDEVGRDFPGTAAFVQLWQRRLEETKRLLTEMEIQMVCVQENE